MTKFNGILSVLALALAMTACGYQGPDADEGDETQEGTPSDQKPPQKDGTGGSAGAEADGGAGAPASGGSDAGTGGKGTDAGSGGSPPVTTDAGSGGSPADAGSGGSDAGGSGGGDAGGGGSTQPDPVIVTGTCAMKFSTAYVGNSTTAEVRGNLPGATWSSGPTVTDTNADKYLEYSAVSIGAGFYELTYMVPPSTWANLGDSTALKAMTPAAREFVNCNWWDPVALKTVSVSSPSCNVRIMVGGGCTISAAGNMKDFK